MEIGTIIVTAGLSSRMGEFKALKEILGQPVILHIVNKFKSIGIKKIVIVTGNHEKELKEALKNVEGLTFILNKDYKHSDMFTSAKLGLAYMKGKCTKCFFTPVDAPAFSINTLTQLLQANGKLVKPRHAGKGGHPILLDESLLSTLLNYQGEDGMKGALRACGEDMTIVEVVDSGILFNTNTPEDFEQMKIYYEK